MGNDTSFYSDKPITFQAALLGLDEESEQDDISVKDEKVLEPVLGGDQGEQEPERATVGC